MLSAWNDDGVCPIHGNHEPDWTTVVSNYDGHDWYVDVCCIHCGRSGCVGSSTDLNERIQW